MHIRFLQNANYGYSYFGVSPRYNIGVDYGYNVSNRFRPRIEFKYVSVMYGLNFSNTVYNITDKDFVTVNYFDINLHFDYLLLTIKNFQLFASPALKYEFELNAYPEVNWSPYLNMEHPGNLLGGAIAPIFKYNLSDHLGLTLTPEYTIFLEPFASGNSKPYIDIVVTLALNINLEIDLLKQPKLFFLLIFAHLPIVIFVSRESNITLDDFTKRMQRLTKDRKILTFKSLRSLRFFFFTKLCVVHFLKLFEN